MTKRWPASCFLLGACILFYGYVRCALPTSTIAKHRLVAAKVADPIDVVVIWFLKILELATKQPNSNTSVKAENNATNNHHNNQPHFSDESNVEYEAPIQSTTPLSINSIIKKKLLLERSEMHFWALDLDKTARFKKKCIFWARDLHKTARNAFLSARAT